VKKCWEIRYENVSYWPLSAYVVEGTDAIYLAGRTDITVPPASEPWFFLLRHAGPTPEEAMETHPDFVPVIGGSIIQAVAPATGGVDFYNGFGLNYFPPGGNGVDGSNLWPLDGISGYIGPQGPLAGVFLDVSLEVTIDIKFCSDPNAFNCKKKGVLPVTIFGTADFFVEDIDFSSVQLCTEDLVFCTGAPRDWSFADRGTPSDAGAAQCGLVEEPPLSGILVEMDYLNPDTYLDVDVAFEAHEVRDMLGAFCSADKGTISEPLVITGTTMNGVTLFSVPVPNVGIDQLWKANK